MDPERQIQVSSRLSLGKYRLSRTLVHSRPQKRHLMPLLHIVMVLIVVGVLLWLVNRFIPMQGTIKSILNAVVIIVVVLWLLNIFGLFRSFQNIRIGS